MCKCIHPSFSAYLPRMEGMVYSQDAGQHNGERQCAVSTPSVVELDARIETRRANCNSVRDPPPKAKLTPGQPVDST